MTVATNKSNFAQNLDTAKVSVSSKPTDKPRVFSNITRLLAHKIGCENASNTSISCLDHLGLVINDTASNLGMFMNPGISQNMQGHRGFQETNDYHSSAPQLKGYVAICINALPHEFHESAYEKVVLEGALKLKDKCIAPLEHTLLLPFDELDGITISNEARQIITDRNIELPLKITLIDKKTQRPLTNSLHCLALKNSDADGNSNSAGSGNYAGNSNSAGSGNDAGNSNCAGSGNYAGNSNSACSGNDTGNDNGYGYDGGNLAGASDKLRTVDDIAISHIDVLDFSKRGHLALYFDHIVFGQDQRIGYRHARRGASLLPEISDLDKHDANHLSYFDAHVYDHKSIFDELLLVDRDELGSSENYKRYIDIVKSLMDDEQQHFAEEHRRNQTSNEASTSNSYSSKQLKLALNNHNDKCIDSSYKYFNELAYFLLSIPESIRIYAGQIINELKLSIIDFGIDSSDINTENLVLDSTTVAPLYLYPELFYRKAISEQNESQRMCDFFLRLHSEIGNTFSPQKHASALALKHSLKLLKGTDYVALKSGILKSPNFAVEAYISVYTQVATQMMYEYIFKHMHKRTAALSDEETIDCSIKPNIAISPSSANHGKSYITPLCAPSLLDDEHCCLILGKSTVFVLEKMQSEYASYLCLDAQKRRSGLKLLSHLIFSGCSCGHVLTLLTACSVAHVHSLLDTGIYRGNFADTLYFNKEHPSLCLLQVLLQGGFNLMRAHPLLVHFLLKDAFKDPHTPVNPYHAHTKLRCLQALVHRGHAMDNEVIRKYSYDVNSQAQLYKDYTCADHELGIACEYDLESLTEAELLELKTLDESDDLYAMTFGIASTKFFSYRFAPVYDLSEVSQDSNLQKFVQNELYRRSLVAKSNYARFYMSKELHRHQALFELQSQGYDCEISDLAFDDFNSTEFDKVDKLQFQALTCSLELVTRLFSFTGDMRFLSGLKERDRLFVIKKYLGLNYQSNIRYEVGNNALISCYAQEIERRKFKHSLYSALAKYNSNKHDSANDDSADSDSSKALASYALSPLVHPKIEQLDQFIETAFSKERIINAKNLNLLTKHLVNLYERNQPSYKDLLALFAKFVVLDKRTMRYRIIHEGTSALLLPHNFTDLTDLLDISIETAYQYQIKKQVKNHEYGVYRGDLPLYPYNTMGKKSSFAYYADEVDYIYKPPMHTKMSTAYIKSVDNMLYVIARDFLHKKGIFTPSLINTNLAFKTAMLLCNISWTTPLATYSGRLTEHKRFLRSAQRRLLPDFFEIYSDRLRGLHIANIMLACDDRDVVKLLNKDNIHEYLKTLCYFYGSSSHSSSNNLASDYANKRSPLKELFIAYKKPFELAISATTKIDNKPENTDSSTTDKANASSDAANTTAFKSNTQDSTKSSNEFGYTSKNVESYFNYEDPLNESLDLNSSSFSSTLSLGPSLTLDTKGKQQPAKEKEKDKEPFSLLSTDTQSTLVLTPVSSLSFESEQTEDIAPKTKPLAERFEDHNPFKDLADDDEDDADIEAEVEPDEEATAESETDSYDDYDSDTDDEVESDEEATAESGTDSSDDYDSDTDDEVEPDEEAAAESDTDSSDDYDSDTDGEVESDEEASTAESGTDSSDDYDSDTDDEVESDEEATAESETDSSDDYDSDTDDGVESDEEATGESETDSYDDYDSDTDDEVESYEEATAESETDSSDDYDSDTDNEVDSDEEAAAESDTDSSDDYDSDTDDEVESGEEAAAESETDSYDDYDSDTDDEVESDEEAAAESETDSYDDYDSDVDSEADDEESIDDESDLADEDDSDVDSEVDDEESIDDESDLADEDDLDVDSEADDEASIDDESDLADEDDLDVDSEADDEESIDDKSIDDESVVADEDEEGSDAQLDAADDEEAMDYEAPFIEDLEDEQDSVDEEHELYSDVEDGTEESCDLSDSEDELQDFDDEFESNDEYDEDESDDEFEDELEAEAEELDYETEFAALAEQYLIKFSKQRYKKAIISTVLGLDSFFKFYKYRRRFESDEEAIKVCAMACSYMLNNELEYLHELLTKPLNETPDLGLDITFFDSNDDESYEVSDDDESEAELTKLSRDRDDRSKKGQKNSAKKSQNIKFYDYDCNDYSLLQKDFNLFFDVLVENTIDYLSKKDLISYYSLTEQEDKLKPYLKDQPDLQEIFNCLMPSQITYILKTVAHS